MLGLISGFVDFPVLATYIKNTGLLHNTTDRYCFYLPEEMLWLRQLSVFQAERILSESSSIVLRPLRALQVVTTRQKGVCPFLNQLTEPLFQCVRQIGFFTQTKIPILH